MFAFQMAFNLNIVSFYEFIDCFFLPRNLKENGKKAVLLGIALIFSLLFFLSGIDFFENNFGKKMLMSISGNLIGYAEIMIYLIKIKKILKSLIQTKT